tara:strand:- start:272 stop:616 length:345 start_codon:yes stop_codon:yes gene_type:complete
MLSFLNQYINVSYSENNMTCKVIAEWNIKKGLAETFVGAITNGLPNTRKLDGCLKIDFSISEEDPHHCFMTQEWETSQHHKNYVQGLKDSGAWEKLLSLLDNEPTFTYCKLTDI